MAKSTGRTGSPGNDTDSHKTHFIAAHPDKLQPGASRGDVSVGRCTDNKGESYQRSAKAGRSLAPGSKPEVKSIHLQNAPKSGSRPSAAPQRAGATWKPGKSAFNYRKAVNTGKKQ